MAIYTISNYLRLNVWETANTQSYVTLSMTLEKNDSHPVRNVVGTLKLGGRNVSVNITSGNYGDAGAVLYTVSGVSPSYGGNNTVTSTVSFIGTYEVFNVPTLGQWGSQTANFTDYYTATRPVSASMTTSATTVTLGNSINITTSGGTSGAMTFKVGGTTVETKANIGNTTTSWTPSIANYAPLNTTGTSMTCTISWNNITKNVTLTIPQNSSTKPSATVAMTVNSGALAGLYVQGKSTAKATVSTSTQHGASISSVSVTMNGTTLAATATDGTKVTWTAVSGLLTTSGSNTCSVTITDSRGFTNTASASFTVQAYSSPTISGVSIYRSDSGGTASTTGTYIRFNFTPTISPVTSGGTSYNAKTYKLRYKLQTASTWTDTTGTLTSYTAATGFTIGSGNIATTSAYDAQLTISDSFETITSATFAIPTEAVMMDFNSAGTGGGIGMYTQGAGLLDVAWKLRTHGGLELVGGGVENLSLQGLGSKNLAYKSYNANTRPGETVNGVTFTEYPDERMMVSGPCTGSFAAQLKVAHLAPGDYILTGTPSGGGTTTAYLNIFGVANDTGSGAAFTITTEGDYAVRLLFGTASFSNLLFSPMIRKASITDGTYVPYAPSNAELATYPKATILRSNLPIYYRMPNATNYGSVLVFGFAQGIGGVCIAVQITNSAIGQVRDLYSGSAFSNSYLSFSFTNGVLKITSTSSSNSWLVVLGG